MAHGGSFGATEESAATGVRRVKRWDSRTEDRCRPVLTSPRGLSAHLPGRVGAGSWGLGFGLSAGRGLAVWTQPEGVSTPRLARRESRKSLELPQRQETFPSLCVSWCTSRGDSERRLKELQRRARGAARSADPRDGHEMLRLLLPPPRSLCASTGHYPHLPSGSLCSPPLPVSRDPGTTSPGERTACLGLVQRHAGLCHCRLTLPPYPSLPPAWVSQSPQSSGSYNPVLSERRTDALRRPTRRGGVKSKAEPRELWEQRREREISPSSLRSSGLNLHNQLDVPCICGIPE